MRDWLQELRAQRALVRQQLRWLDDKIAGLEADTKADTGPGETSSAEEPAGQPALSPGAAFPWPRDPQQTGSENSPDLQPAAFAQSTTDQLRRAKVGCLILFAAATIGFLFLLFGLPYRKRPTKHPLCGLLKIR